MVRLQQREATGEMAELPNRTLKENDDHALLIRTPEVVPSNQRESLTSLFQIFPSSFRDSVLQTPDTMRSVASVIFCTAAILFFDDAAGLVLLPIHHDSAGRVESWPQWIGCNAGIAGLGWTVAFAG